jgi:hypothetical protein
VKPRAALKIRDQRAAIISVKDYSFEQPMQIALILKKADASQ